MFVSSRRDRLVSVALVSGMSIPFLYFFIQIAAAPFYPGYSFLNQDASTLGSDGSSLPSIFNVGAILLGLSTLFAAWGVLQSLLRLNVNPAVVWPVVFAVAGFGLSSVNAGVFPMPDPRHTEGLFALVGIGSFFLPLLMPVAIWKLPAGRLVKAYLLANILMLLALIPVMSGLIQVVIDKFGTESPSYQSFLNNYHGIFQRLFALITTGPIGIGAFVLAKRTAGSNQEIQPTLHAEKAD